MKSTNVGRIRNQKKQKNNTSGHTGVVWHEGNGKWYARISFRGKTYSLGYFDNLQEAINKRKQAEKMTFEQFIERLDKAETITI